MAIGKITGTMLYPNLERQGADLAIDGNLFYFDVTNRRVGVNTSTPGYDIDAAGNVRLANLKITGNVITSNTGKINLGTISNVVVGGGTANYIMYTDGAGNLNWGNLNALSQAQNFYANVIQLGANASGSLVSNAVTLTSGTNVTDSIAQLNYVLGKLVPPSPPPFPGNASTISIGGLTTYGRMCNFTQTDNTGWGNLQMAAATSFSSLRTGAYNTSGTPILNVGPGTTGTVTAYLNRTPTGNVTLTGSNANTTNGNLYVYNVQDYHNFLSSVTAGFWTAFSAYATGTITTAGWNSIAIYDSYTNTATNTAYWYYDNSAPGNPTWANAVAITNSNVVTNAVSYSSTIPHFNSNAIFRLKANISKLSGDQYYSSDTFIVGSAGGAFLAPTSVTYTQAGVTTPLARNLYVSSGSAYFETNVAITTGIGSSAAAPSLTAYNSYGSTSQTFTPSQTILYKTGNVPASANVGIDETNISVRSSLGGGYSSNGVRIIPYLSGNSDTPSYAGNATNDATFDSVTGTLNAWDAKVVAGVLKQDTTNYSLGTTYLPIGPNFSSHNATQYFTLKFQRSTLSGFSIVYTGTLAGLWVALPGTATDSTSTLNGWLDASVAYSGSGTPGANTGAGGNGSNGCAVGGNAVLNSAQTNKVVTVTFGGASSSGSTNNMIYVRVKLTSGQSLTGLSIT
jgi:hypothetical protein